MPSTHDAPDRRVPARPSRRRVLRKIDEGHGGPLATLRPPPPSPGPSPAARFEPRAAGAPAASLGRSHVSPAMHAPQPPPMHTLEPSPPAVGVAYASVPPVVATVPPGSPLDALGGPREPARGSFRGVFIGAALGLAIVGMFVAGTRLGGRAAVAPPLAAAAAVQPAAQPQLVTPGVETPAARMTADVLPTIAATQLPPARPLRAARPGKVAAATARPAPAPEAVEKAPDPAADDSAASLVPVIPVTPAPTVDPFVKAVQSDIDEDSSGGANAARGR